MGEKYVNFYDNKETNLRDYLRIIFLYKYVIATVVIVVMSGVIIKAQFKTPMYTASVKMIVAGYYKEKSEEINKNIFNLRGLLTTHVEMVKSGAVLERVVKALKLYERPLDDEKNVAPLLKRYVIEKKTEELNSKLAKLSPDQKKAFLFNQAMLRLSESVSAAPQDDDSSIYVIRVSDINPNAAVIIANVVARSIVIYDLEKQLANLKFMYGDKHSSVVILENNIQDLLGKLDSVELPDLEAAGPASVKIAYQAQTAEGGEGGLVGFNLVVTLFMSLFFGVMIAVVFDYADMTLKSPHDIEKHINIPFLGSIPRNKANKKILIGDENPQIINSTSAYKNLSDRICLLIKNKNIKSLLLISAEDSRETSVVTANVGIYLSHKLGHKVLIIDANLREPMLSKIFNTENTPGLNNILERKISFYDAVRDLDSNLSLLTAGETVFNPVTLFDSPMMADVIKQAKDNYDIVLVNCSGMKNFTDATTISSLLEGVIVVINEGKERRYIVKSAVAQLERQKANIIGGILANRRHVIPELIYRIT